MIPAIYRIFVLAAFATHTSLGRCQTAAEFWPALNARLELPHQWRALAGVGVKHRDEIGYKEVYTGAGIGYQLRRIGKPHIENIDSDKEHNFVFGAGYEYLHSLSSGKSSYENRGLLSAVSGFRPFSWLLVRDRNRVEFRWINGNYSTRYRNNLYVAHEVLIHNFRFDPYASAEVFYNGATTSWNEEQYTAGIEWPYGRKFMAQTYYLRENCTTCNPRHLNVGGLTLNLFF